MILYWLVLRMVVEVEGPWRRTPDDVVYFGDTKTGTVRVVPVLLPDTASERES